MQIPDDLKKYNLVGPAKPQNRRLVATGEGGPASGKTTFFYGDEYRVGFPRPALVIQLDMNDQGLKHREQGDDILFHDVVVPPFGVHTEAVRERDFEIAMAIRDLFTVSIKKNYFRSYMIDEGYALYQLARRAHLVNLDFGGEAQASYAPVNAYMARFFTMAKQNRVNLFIPHRLKEERKSGFNQAGKKTSTLTGNLVYDGWKHALYDSQCHILFEKDNKPSKGMPKYTATIQKCTANSTVEGEVLMDDDITLPVLGTKIWPLSGERDWLTL